MKKHTVTKLLIVLSIAALSTAMLSAVGPAQTAAVATPQSSLRPGSGRARVERGAHLVRTMGCNDCHTPWQMGPKGPEPDMARALTGHPAEMVMPPPPPAAGPWIGHIGATNTAWAGPWGVSFTAN